MFLQLCNDPAATLCLDFVLFTHAWVEKVFYILDLICIKVLFTTYWPAYTL